MVASKKFSIEKISFPYFTGKSIQIAVIDSGCAYERYNDHNLIQGVRFRVDSQGNIDCDSDCHDQIGHGTASIGIILKKAPDAVIYPIKIFTSELETRTEILVEAIRHAINQNVNIINLSLGTTSLNYAASLKEMCEKAHKNNIIIVAAEDNENSKSYPASFPSVLGVTAGKVYQKYGYYYRKNYPIEIVARGDRQRLNWTNPKYIFMGGSSFAAPHITGIVALILEAYPDADFEKVKEILIANALQGTPELVDGKKLYQVNGGSVSSRIPMTTTNEVDKESNSHKNLGWIRKAVIYPYNKEMHSLIRYQDLLQFEIVGVVDEVARLSVGKDAGETIGTNDSGMIIVPASKLEAELEKADTLILGYLDEVGRIKKRDILGEVSLKAVSSMSKNIYSLSRIPKDKYPEIWQIAQNKGLKVRYPKVNMDSYIAVTNNSANHTEKITTTPIVGVFGTGPQQGKFTAQLALRRRLLASGYKVGQIGTEHQSELFGFDCTFPVGYANSVELTMERHIPFLRSKIREIDSKGYDIIIVGGQSGIIPYELNSYSNVYTLPTITFLFGTNPDAYILTVNTIDSDEYVKNCINALKILGKGDVILLTFSDQEKVVKPGFGRNRVTSRKMPKEKIDTKIKDLEKAFSIPATEVVSEKGQEKFFNTVIDYFSRQ